MKEQTKKMILMWLFAAMGAIILAGIGWWAYKTLPYAYYESKKDGIGMKYPRGWKMYDHPDAGVIAVFISPKEGPLDLAQENFTITTTDFTAFPVTLEQYVADTKSQMLGTFNNLKIAESVPATFDGHKGWKFVFQAKSEPPLTTVAYAFLDHDVAYNITYMGNTNQYPKDKPMIEDVIRSLKVNF